MAADSVDVVTAVAVLAVLWCRPVAVLGVLVATIMLVPDQLVVPHLFSSNATVDHLVVAATGLRVASMVRRGEVPRDIIRATPLHLALGFLLATWCVTGVVFATRTSQPSFQIIRLVDITASAVTFVAALALLRAIRRPWLLPGMLVAALVVLGGIALAEHTSHGPFGYGYHLFSAVDAGHTSLSGALLEPRAGHLRVRASAEFALSFGWIVVMLLPAAVVLVRRAGSAYLKAAGLIAVGLGAVAVYLTYTRSAVVAVPAAVIVVAVLTRDRWLLRVALAVAAGSGIAVAASPVLRQHVSLATDQGAVAIRFQRLPLILQAVATHPYRGLGFGGLERLGLPTSDNFYLLTYASTGVIGATALVALLVTAACTVGRALRLQDASRRLVAGAAATGLLGFAVSGLFDDALFINQPAQLAFLLLALLVATTEAELSWAAMPKFSWPRLGLFAALGAAAGAVALLVAPTRAVQQRSFSTVSAVRDSAPADPEFVATFMIGSVCDVARAVVASEPATTVSCRDDFTAAGLGTLRVEAPDATAVTTAYSDIAAAVTMASYLGAYQTQTSGIPHRVHASGWRTAPASGAAAGLAVGLIAPLPLRRRRNQAARESEPRPAPTAE